MKKILIIFLAAVGLLIVGSFLLFTNFGKSTATIEFGYDEKTNSSTMKVTGPYGWQCITIEKEKLSPDEKNFRLSGLGYTNIPLFGGANYSTNYYPTKGEIKNIPLEQEYLIYKPNQFHEYYILVSKDLTKYESLRKEYGLR